MSLLFPYTSYTITTHISEVEAFKRIGKQVRITKGFWDLWLRWSNEMLPYKGKITGNTFKIIRNIKYNNPGLPAITGKIEQQDGKTYIHIRMRPEWFVILLDIILFSTFGGGAILFNIEWFKDAHHSLQTLDKQTIYMFILVCLFILVPFHIEASISRKFFANLFKNASVAQ
jgi:hypothetical protein